MATKIIVQNLPNNMTEDGLKDVFSQVGEVKSAKMIVHALTRRLSGSGIVEMMLEVDADRAINYFDGSTFRNNKIVVQKHYPILERSNTMIRCLIYRYSMPGARVFFNALRGFKQKNARHGC